MDAKEAIKRLREEALSSAMCAEKDRVNDPCPYRRLAAALNLAIAALEREHAERWRSVEEEAPEALVRVLVTFYRDNEAEVSSALYSRACGWLTEGYALHGVTHWRPLPASAKEESRG